MSKLSRRWRRLRQAISERLGQTYTLDGVGFTLPPFADDVKRNILRGNYEAPERRLVARLIDGTRPVIELGGAFGIVSGVTATRLRPDTVHVVVEANPVLVETCRANATRPRASGAPTTIVHAAVGYDGKQLAFVQSEGFLGSRLALPGEAGTVNVETVKLGDLVRQYVPEGDYDLICDIEGAELDIVRHDAAGLSRCRLAIVEIHADAFAARGSSEAAFLDLLAKAGMEVAERDENVVVARRLTI